MNEDILKKMGIAIITFLLISILALLLYASLRNRGYDYKDVYGIFSMKKNYVQPAWDMPDWVINDCKKDVSTRWIYRCDLDLFLYAEGAWETTATYLDYNGNDLAGSCGPFHPSDACRKYEGECSKMEIICPQGSASLVTNSREYNKNDIVKINYNIDYYIDNDVDVSTFVERIDNNGGWFFYSPIDVEVPRGASNYEVNFGAEWIGNEEGEYRIVLVDNLMRDLSNCDKASGACGPKIYYSDTFEIFALEQSVGNCAEEGEPISSLDLSLPTSEWRDCCDGLTKTATYAFFDNTCYSRSPVVCTKCNNGECGPGEDACNCPQDCEEEISVSDWRLYEDEVCGFAVRIPETVGFNKTGENTGYWFGKMSIHMQGGYFLNFRCAEREDMSIYDSFYCDDNIGGDERCELYMWGNEKIVIDWDYEEKDSRAIAKIYKNEDTFVIIDINSPPSSDEVKAKFLKIGQSLEFN
ncbi:MAG: hypothetical protein PHI66_00525 [Candidatus Pacebacteria bacterium]|nr:hypothetical protein [Candidatus Paceibacterota bacterium]